jgi:nicotinamidase-related amidase
MSELIKWEKSKSKIWDTDYKTWNTEQMNEWLIHFERIPKEWAHRITAECKTGAELARLSRQELKNLGIPWGLCSHISKGQEQLHATIHHIFHPMFVPSNPYPWPYNGDLRMDNTALLIIDMQKDFVGPEGYAATMYPDAYQLLRAPIPHIKKLLDFGREAGLTIIHTREGHHSNLTDCPKNKRWRSEGVKAGIGNPSSGSALTIGSDHHDIIPELYPKPGEDVIDKPGKGSFYATNLDMLLKTEMIDNIIITGVTTDVCVHTTLRDANDMGFECILVEDGCAAVDPKNQAAAIDMVHKSGGIFGATATTDVILEVLKAQHEREQAAKKHHPKK